MLALFPDIRAVGYLDDGIALPPGQRLGRHWVLPSRPDRATCRSPGAPGVVLLVVLRARRLLAPNGARARRAVCGRPRGDNHRPYLRRPGRFSRGFFRGSGAWRAGLFGSPVTEPGRECV